MPRKTGGWNVVVRVMGAGTGVERTRTLREAGKGTMGCRILKMEVKEMAECGILKGGKRDGWIL